MRRTGSLPFLLVGLFALIAFALGAVHLDSQSMWRDEVDAIRFAAAPWGELVAGLTRPGWNGPLYFVLLRGWIAATGASPYSVRYLSLLSGVLCVPLVYAAGRRLFDRSVAAVAALVAASSPYLAWYSVEAKMYTLVTALTLISIYALRRGFDGGGWYWWAAQIITTSLAAYSHILAALLIPVEVLLYLTWHPRTRRQWMGLLAFAILVLPYLPLLRWQLPLLLRSRATGFAPTPLAEILVTLVTAWSTGPYPPCSWLRALPSVLAGVSVWGLGAAALAPRSSSRCENRRDRSRASSALSAAIWAAGPALVVGVISLWQPIFTDRYLIWSAPAFYLLVALGVRSVASLGRHALSISMALAALLYGVNTTSASLQLSANHKADFRAVARFVAGYSASEEIYAHEQWARTLPQRSYLPLVIGRGAPADTPAELIIFQIPHARHAFDYYWPGPAYAYTEGPFTNHRTSDGFYLTSEQEVASQMATITDGHNPIWLVATEVEMWDDRRLTQLWLDANLRREFVAHFAHIDLFRYSRQPAD